MNDNQIEKLIEIAAQENSQTARQRLFETIRLVEVFSPCNMDPHDDAKITSIPLARLSDGSHAMMLFTSKSHPHLSEHAHYAGGAFMKTLTAALEMPELDWVILHNRDSRWVAINRQQIPAVLQSLGPDRKSSDPATGTGTDPSRMLLENMITNTSRSKSGELPASFESAIADQEIFLEMAARENPDGQPVMKTFHIEHLRHVVRVYTSRVRPGLTYGGIRWNALKEMIRSAPGIGGVQIMNNADDWIVFDRETLGLGASENS
jgi:SseB protein N-terminal domain